MNEHEHEPDDVVMDWALGERVGGQRPPDLVAAVRARLGEVSSAGRARRHLAVAGLLLAGVVVVCGVAFWSARHDARATPAIQGPAPTVQTVGDARALPPGTIAAQVSGGDDHVIEALAQLRSLEELVVREPWNEVSGLGLKMVPGVSECPVSNAAWQHLAVMSRLRRLEFSGTRLVTRLQGAYGADVITAVSRLPLLESLSLRYLNTTDEALARLPGLRHLRHLDLSFNHGFTEAGIEAIVQCRSLRTLSLRGCQQLHAPWIARLHQLPELEHLDLSSIDGINWASGTGFTDAVDAEILERARGSANNLSEGVQDHALAELAKLPKLRVLEIGGGTWSLAGLYGIDACTTLEELGMTGGRTTGDAGFVRWLPRGLRRLEVCGPYTDEFCVAVRERLPNLRHLGVAACDGITDAGLRELLAMPSLRVLDMRQMRGLTAGCIDALAAAQQLEALDIRHCPFVTAEDVERLRRALPNVRRLDATVPDESPR